MLGPAAAVADETVIALAVGLSRESGKALAANSANNYAGPWRKFLGWWRARGLPGTVYDIPPALVGLYLYSLYVAARQDGVGEGRVRQASGAIHHHFTAAGLESPTNHPSCSIVRQLAAKGLAPRHFHRDALQLEDLRAFISKHGGPGARLLPLMMCAAVSLMFFGFLRFDDMAEVCVHSDLLIIAESHMEVFLPRSKADQVWKGAWVVVGRIGGPVCPVGLVSRLLAEGGYRRSPRTDNEDVGPLLRAVQHNKAGGRLRRLVGTTDKPVWSMPYNTFRERLAEMCGEAGIPGRITPHSMRIGGNSEAADRGVPEEVRRTHGRWLSARMVDLYTRRTVDGAIGLTQRLGLH